METLYRNRFNFARNAVKHLDPNSEDEIDLDPQYEAGSLILRAVRNYLMVLPDAEEDFEEACILISSWNIDQDFSGFRES